MKRQFHTPELRARILAARRSGISPADLAERFGMTVHAVKAALQRARKDEHDAEVERAAL